MKETPITRYDQLRHGMRVRCKIGRTEIDEAMISRATGGDGDSRFALVFDNECGWEMDDTVEESFGYSYAWYVGRSICDDYRIVAIDDIKPKREAPEPWTLIYERGSDKLTQDLIFTDEFPEGISRDDLNAKTNRYRALVAAHKKHFPSKK